MTPSGGMVSSIVVLNCFVHALMYSYYFLMIYSPETRATYEHFKKNLTQVQLVSHHIHILIQVLQSFYVLINSNSSPGTVRADCFTISQIGFGYLRLSQITRLDDSLDKHLFLSYVFQLLSDYLLAEKAQFLINYRYSNRANTCFEMVLSVQIQICKVQ